MPQIGETENAIRLGYKAYARMRWTACIVCKKERWIRLSQYKKGEKLSCMSCSKTGPKNVSWRGGKNKNNKGYIHVWVPKDNPYYLMTKGRRGRILEHRLNMAEHLGRCLERGEVVHHKNGIRHDNRIENLELISCKGKHNTHEGQKYQELINEIKRLSERVDEQARQIKILKYQVRHSRKTAKEDGGFGNVP